MTCHPSSQKNRAVLDNLPYDVVAVACDLDRPRDGSGLVGKLMVDGEERDCVMVERWALATPIKRGEIIGLVLSKLPNGVTAA